MCSIIICITSGGFVVELARVQHSSIQDSCQFYYQQSYLESWYIQNQQELLNRECAPLPPIYKALFNTYK